MGAYQLLLAGGNQQWRNSLRAFIDKSPFLKMVASVPFAEMVETALRLKPELLLWKLERENPLPALEELKLQCPFTLTVILVNDPRKYKLIELLQSGLQGCLTGQMFPRQIVKALELVAGTGLICLPRPVGEWWGGPVSGCQTAACFSLTKRESEILTLLVKNLQNQEIAAALYLSESTVKTHLKSIFRKLGVRNRTEALSLALRLGLVETGEPAGVGHQMADG